MIKKYILLAALFALNTKVNAQSFTPPVVQETLFPKDSFNIEKYGANADGQTLNTVAIANAIDACSRKGGGTVVIPAGLWMTGPIALKSNVNLHLQANAILSFTTDFSQYKIIASNWEGVPAARNQPPLSADNASNIAITGKGIIDGNGDAWRQVKKDKLTESQWKRLVKSGGLVSADNRIWYPSASSLKGTQTEKAGILLNGKTISDFEDIKDFLRPNLLVFTKCDRVLLEGVTFQNSAAWCLHPLMSSNIIVRNIYVKNPWYAQNGDGIDLESCNNVIIENSVFDVGDDGICIKSGRDAEGRKRAMPTKDVIVRNCTVYHAHGGFVIGSEMSGGANNISVDNCSFIGTDIGLRFKTTRGRGGIVENIFMSNIAMKDIVGEAILFDMYYAAKDPIPLAGEKREAPKVESRPATEETPQFRNFDIKNVTCNGAAKAIFIRGLPEMNIKDIRMKNMVISADLGMQCTEATGISLKNVTILSANTAPVIDIFNSSNINFSEIVLPAKSETVLRLGGEKTIDIKWKNNAMLNTDQQVVFEFGATKKSLSVQ